jgi:hypothetical protein
MSSSGEDAYEVETNFTCANEECGKDNDDVTCWADGAEITYICTFCGYEDTVDL